MGGGIRGRVGEDTMNQLILVSIISFMAGVFITTGVFILVLQDMMYRDKR